MEEYLNKGIKEIITKFPKVGDILNEYNIGCVPCNVGSCLLRDIVEIHNLDEEEECELLMRISRVIYPDRKIELPQIKRKPRISQTRYSPPIKRLVDEHTLIKRWLSLIPVVLENLDINSEPNRGLILEGVDFIRKYADKFHHAKEEDILFEYTDKNLEIIQTIYKDHETGRNHVKVLVEAVDKRDMNVVIEHLNGYKDLLTEHIKKEDEILYPWIDRGLSTTQVGELFSRFNEADEKSGEEVPEKYRRFVEKVEEKFKNQMKPRLMERTHSTSLRVRPECNRRTK